MNHEVPFPLHEIDIPPATAGLRIVGVHLPLRWADYGLIAFDMDSTLVAIECVDELADIAGCKAEVAAITEAAMQGKLTDYKESLRRRVALLRGVKLSQVDAVVRERMRLNPGVEAVVAACKKAGLRLLLVSGGFTLFTDHIRDRLGFDFVRSNVLEVEGDALTGRLVEQPWGDICDGAEKRRMLEQTCAQLGISPRAAIAVGDGANDLPMMHAAGLSVAYHAKPAVRAQAMVSIEEGGMDRLLELFGR
ncbi:phosphoserine phosphatase SerB [Candidatus Symbiobacter mobilis]|uniref:Phosphoserine phosphatase n=1 Tax=Candidatus Symbiobacter mobilis CR TaxID=946483 RepID=U5N4Y3_9BURK|nr:phosphoserine phosphatase SerB [Candidatus Symbiobacter mobilis]AGX86566.1 phosphoserine phosphatase [Candidatus Symbiobacter mobilis CR]